MQLQSGLPCRASGIANPLTALLPQNNAAIGQRKGGGKKKYMENPVAGKTGEPVNPKKLPHGCNFFGNAHYSAFPEDHGPNLTVYIICAMLFSGK
jgi:hypothetical protein